MGSVPQDKMLLGPYFAHQLLNSPRHVLFTLARYKFAAKLLSAKWNLDVLELGCNEGIGTLILSEFDHKITAVDFDENAIAHARDNIPNKLSINFLCDDFLAKQYGKYDAVISLDVIEHISPEEEHKFMETVVKNLTKNGICIIGTPNDSASRFASEASMIGHINMYDHQRLTAMLNERFHHVFLFGMNDEVAHVGFYPMCHYLIALACSPKNTI